MQNNEWTESEISFLRARYPEGHKIEIILGLPGRAWHSIHQKAWKLSLKRNRTMCQPLTLPLHQRVNILDEADAAWLASAIDGEGSLALNYEDHNRVKGGSLSAYLRIDNTNLDYVKRALEITGIGYVKSYWHCFGKRRTYQSGNYLMHCYTIHGTRSVASVLEQILPFLIIKKDRAILIIEFTKLLEQDGPRMRRFDPRIQDIYYRFVGCARRAKADHYVHRLDIIKWWSMC